MLESFGELSDFWNFLRTWTKAHWVTQCRFISRRRNDHPAEFLSVSKNVGLFIEQADILHTIILFVDPHFVEQVVGCWM